MALQGFLPSEAQVGLSGGKVPLALLGRQVGGSRTKLPGAEQKQDAGWTYPRGTCTGGTLGLKSLKNRKRKGTGENQCLAPLGALEGKVKRCDFLTQIKS